MPILRFLMPCFLLFSMSGNSYSQNFIFPDDFIAHWFGDLEIFEANGNLQKIGMEIIISKSNNIDTFNYTLNYIKDEVVDQRDYLIVKDQQNPRLLKIDELNGIILDLEQFGNKWISVFRIHDSLIHFHLNLYENQMLVEIFSIEQEDVRFTGGGSDEIPTIAILKNSVYQRALLEKK